MKKKRSIMCFLLVFVLTFSTLNIYAADSYNETDIPVTSTICISDPETGDIWKWDVPTTQSQSVSRSYSNGESISTVSVDVDISKYLLATYSDLSQEAVLNDDITVKAGLSYSVKNKLVAIHSAFGSTTASGLYYAENRKFYWRNPYSGGGGAFSPTSNSWSYEGDGVYATYLSSTPPYALTDCRIRVSGMSSYRDVSIICSLSL